MTSTSETITLIGAGLVGPLLATGLVKRGFEVEIYERRPDMRHVSMSAGRSINLNRFSCSQQYLDYGYKELTIPAGPNGGHVLDPHALHIWPRGNYMLIALPNVDGTFGCILFLPLEGHDSFAQLSTRADVADFFRANFPDAVALMPEFADNFFANPTGSMVTIK